VTARRKDREPVHDSPIGWVRAHAKTYAATRGAVGHIARGLPNLLLTTRGRKSGLLRRTPLVYARDGDQYVLIASNGGAEEDPLWYLNLVADPDVTAQVGSDLFRARAEILAGDQYSRGWQLILEIMPWCADYRTRRTIPLVRLTRTDEPVSQDPAPVLPDAGDGEG
jgi:deazaflavin-dependent oxidoreductase (nitroreductase family)